MKKVIALSVLVAAAALSAGLGARTTDVGPCVVHSHAVDVSDPDPSECLLCGGNPTVHVRVLWKAQKVAANAFLMRFQ